MRLRNVTGAKEKIETSSYVILNPEKHQGNYQAIFGNEQPIHIEIGMGKGNFIIENAIRYPHINFIGIEKFDSVLVRAIERLEDLDLPNLRLMRFDATSIDQVFATEVDTIYLNFSDPWPKNRHAHRRLTSSAFLKRYDHLFRHDAHIVMKTDNRHLFEFSLISFMEYGYHIEDICLNLYEEDTKDNIPTEYEQRFHNKGFPIYKIEVTKRGRQILDNKK